MSTFSDSYVSKVLLATHTPARGLETVAGRWLRTSLLDPYRPELHYMRSGSEMAGEAPTRQRALDLGRVLAAIERQEVASQLLHPPVISTNASNVDPPSTAAEF
jgi:hypothetical protein